MKKTILFAILNLAKWCGVFALCRWWTGGDLRILCYHGAELKDESRFRPALFMDRQTFARRMSYLARKKYPVIGLDEALDRLEAGTLAKGSTVITIDDGWYGTYKVMGPILKSHGFQATLYVASYYLEKQVQVFMVAVAYVLWSAGRGSLDLSTVTERLDGSFDISKPSERDQAAAILIEHADTLDGAPERQDLLHRVADAVDFDWRSMEAERLISFMSSDEAGALLADGIDLQLHTHRHRFDGLDRDAAVKEIEDNRAALSRITNQKRTHFCFPSGEYTEEQLGWLDGAEVASATTVKSGFIRKGHPKYEMNRFVDSKSVTDLEFEAEMTGFFEVVRRLGYSI